MALERNQIWQWKLVSNEITGLTAHFPYPDVWGWAWYTLGYNPVDKYAILGGGDHQGNQNWTFRYDHVNSTFVQLASGTGMPKSYIYDNAMGVWDPVQQRILFIGGDNLSPVNMVLEWNNVTEEWSDVTNPGNDLKGKSKTFIAIDQVNNKGYLWGGSHNVGYTQEIDFNSDALIKNITPSNPPRPPTSDGWERLSGCWCPEDGCVYCMFGRNAWSTIAWEFWRLEANRQSWTDLTTPEFKELYRYWSLPGQYHAFSHAFLQWIPGADSIVLLGGHAAEGAPPRPLLAALYDIRTNDWTEITNDILLDPLDPAGLGYPNGRRAGCGGAGFYDVSGDLILLTQAQSGDGWWTLTPPARPRETSQITSTFVIAKDVVRFNFTNALAVDDAYLSTANYSVQNLSTGESVEVKQVLPTNDDSSDTLTLYLQRLVEGDSYQLTITKETLSTAGGDLIAELDDTLEVWTQTRTKVDSMMSSMSKLYDLKVSGAARGILEATGVADEEIGGNQGDD